MSSSSPTVPPISTRSQIPTSVQLADKAGDVVGVLVLGALAWHGTITGNVAVGAILGLLGVNTGLRSMGKRPLTSGLGAIAFAVGLLTPLHGALVEGLRAAMDHGHA